VASSKARDVLYQAMCPTFYRRIRMTIEIASDSPAFFVVAMKPRAHNSALGQPLPMAAHALDWGDPSNSRHRGGKWVTMVMMFVDEILVLFLLQKTDGAGVFRSRPNPYSGKAVNRL